MATKKIDEEVYPPVDPTCLAELRDIYSKYTGYQVAECIKVIRAEIYAQKEQEELDEELAALLLKLNKRHPDEIDPCGYED